jgi:subtilisin family serine protease
MHPAAPAAAALGAALAPVWGTHASGAAALAIAALLWGGPLALALTLTRRHAAWAQSAALAGGLLSVAGYALLDALVRALLPSSRGPSLHGEGAWAALVRLTVLVPYALAAAHLVPRWVGAPRRSIWAWLGLSRPTWPTLALVLILAALLTVVWPLTGALGDRLTTLSLALQTLAWALPQALIVWGLLFCLLTSSARRPWMGAALVVLIYALTGLAAALPDAHWGALQEAAAFLPLALLLTELRARESSSLPALLVAFAYRLARLAFVDPRDAIAQGIPEMQHLIAEGAAAAAAAGLALALLLARRIRRSRLARRALAAPVRQPIVRRGLVWALAVWVAWGAWGALYATLGEVGFADDGLLIIMEEQADLSGVEALGGREERLEAVYRTLVATAERTQAPLRAQLDALGVPYRPYYIINMIRVDGHRWLKGRFERWPGVDEVILNPNVRVYPRRLPLPYGPDSGSPAGVQPNLAAIGADAAWRLGVTGAGIVVAGQDTGFDWTHPALKAHYRGWDGARADHNTNWHDAWDGRPEPFDEDGHGTHTMGIVLGDDGAPGGNRIGVAPGARWIGCRNMRRGFGNPGAYAECMEFFLAPYPLGGDPFRDGRVQLAPHVVNNSWGCPEFEGCATDTLRLAVEALRAAGIMMVVSAGNDGPACASATVPPANYDAAFSVGATDNSGQVASFSSRGPAGELIKPDVSAPGSNIRSSLPGGGYGTASGTSMAGPHVAGLVALLWSADPGLIGEVDATEALICRTARPRPVVGACSASEPSGPFAALLANPICACGGVTGSPNNVYGCGVIDAAAAVQAALEK